MSDCRCVHRLKETSERESARDCSPHSAVSLPSSSHQYSIGSVHSLAVCPFNWHRQAIRSCNRVLEQGAVNKTAATDSTVPLLAGNPNKDVHHSKHLPNTLDDCQSSFQLKDTRHHPFISISFRWRRSLRLRRQFISQKGKNRERERGTV